MLLNPVASHAVNVFASAHVAAFGVQRLQRGGAVVLLQP
jgi:hypothetical protein